MNVRRLISIWGLLLITLCVSDAFAAGFYLPGRGVKPNGRAGAFVASGGQDLNSLWYNPANLAGMDELQLTVDLAFVALLADFHRDPRTLENGDVINYESVSNSAAPQADPQVLIGGPLTKDLTWAFGLYAPYFTPTTYPEKGPQRYVLIDTAGSLLMFFHFALAYEVSETFRIGAGVQWIPAQFTVVNMVSAYTGLFGEPEDPDLDILSKITMTSLLSFSGNIGLWWKMADAFEFGASFQAPIVFSDDNAEFESRLPSHPIFNNAELSGNNMSGAIKFPAVIRTGFRLVQPTWDLELTLTYEGWSIFEEIQANPQEVAVTGVPGLGSIPVGPLSIPMNWQDTLSVRLGGDFEVTEALTLRGGYAFETSAVPDSYYSVFIADGQKHVFALGGSFDFGGWSMDATTSYYFIPTRTITDSEVRQINPTDEEHKLTAVIGNGEYTQSYIVGGVGANFKF